MLNNNLSNTSIFTDAEVLFLSSPLADHRSPLMGLHILSEICNKANVNSHIVYSNMHLLNYLGIDKYKNFPILSIVYQGGILFNKDYTLLNKIFKNKTIENHYMLHKQQCMNNLPLSDRLKICFTRESKGILKKELFITEELFVKVQEWISLFTDQIIDKNYNIVGISTMFYDQLHANLAILENIKKKNKNIITILGGSQCRGIMGKSIAENIDYVDYVFEGESDLTFFNFIKDIKKNNHNKTSYVKEVISDNFYFYPEICYKEYDEQYNLLVKPIIQDSLKTSHIDGYPLEMSRGCKWMNISGCNFCSLSPSISKYRTKPINRVISEILKIQEVHKSNKINFNDLLITKEYIKKLAPEFINKLHKFSFHAEIRADLDYHSLKTLKTCGFNSFQIGIESFNSDILKLMNKGTDLSKNIEVLRLGQILKIKIFYNIIWGIPNERSEYYEIMNTLIPKITHLIPPINVLHVEFERFSKYVKSPSNHNVKSILNSSTYKPNIDSKIDHDVNYLLIGDYDCETHTNQEVISLFYEKIHFWRDLWEIPQFSSFVGRKIIQHPVLKIVKVKENTYRIIDTRNDEIKYKGDFVDTSIAIKCLFTEKRKNDDIESWASDHNLIIIDNLKTIPLATASQDLYEELLILKNGCT